MAKYNAITTVTLPAGQAFGRGSIYHLLKVENDGDVGKVVNTDAVTDGAIGVLMEDGPIRDGEFVSVALLQGVVPMKAGDAITAGQTIVPDATVGRVNGLDDPIAAVAQKIVGVASISVVDGEIVPVICGVSTLS